MMLQHILRLHRAEGAQANVEGHKGGFYTLGPDFVQQFLGEVEPGGGGGGGANLPGIDGLIALLVTELCLDIGGRGIFPRRSSTYRKIPS